MLGSQGLLIAECIMGLLGIGTGGMLSENGLDSSHDDAARVLLLGGLIEHLALHG